LCTDAIRVLERHIVVFSEEFLVTFPRSKKTRNKVLRRINANRCFGKNENRVEHFLFGYVTDLVRLLEQR